MRTVYKTGDTERSRPHRKVERYLDELNISYESEIPFPPYRVDIYLSEWHIALEIDGPFHSRAKDKIRDKYLEEFYGLRILRLPVGMLAWNIKNKIQNFIEDHADDCDERKLIWLGKS